VGLTTLPCKKKIGEKPPRNSAGFCGGDQGLSWAVEPRKEERRRRRNIKLCAKLGENTSDTCAMLSDANEKISYEEVFMSGINVSQRSSHVQIINEDTAHHFFQYQG
jgi:hypothetical protein